MVVLTAPHMHMHMHVQTHTPHTHQCSGQNFNIAGVQHQSVIAVQLMISCHNPPQFVLSESM